MLGSKNISVANLSLTEKIIFNLIKFKNQKMNAQSPIDDSSSKTNSFINSLFDDEFKRNMKWSVGLGVVTAVLCYASNTNPIVVLNHTNELLKRTVINPLWDFATTRSIEFLIAIPGAKDILAKIISETILQKATQLWAASTVENRVIKLTMGSLIVFKVLQHLVHHILIFYKSYMSNNYSRTYTFLHNCPNKSEAIKLPIETLNKIIASNPWETFQILINLPHLFPNPLQHNNTIRYPILQKMLTLSGYPEDLCDFLTEKPLWEAKNQHPNLLRNEACIWDVLFVLAQYPDLELPFEILDEILSNFNDPASSLHFLCEYSFLWQDNEAFDEDALLAFILTPQFGPICSHLKEWLPLLKGPYALSKKNKDTLFAINESFNEKISQFISKHVISVYTSEQSKSYFKHKAEGPFLNIQKLLGGNETNKCNSSPLLFISPKYWLQITQALFSLVSEFFPSNIDLITNIKKFFFLCLKSSDAQTKNGKQIILNRIVNIVKTLCQSTHIFVDHKKDLTEIEILQIRKEMETVIEILAEGGTACQDRAIIALILAENRTNLFHNIKCPDACTTGENQIETQILQNMPNALANMFKLHLISAKLVDQNQAENLETYFYHILKLNLFLNLGILTSSTMLYEQLAQKLLLGEAIAKLLTELTADNLIGYTAHLKEFKTLFENESKNTLQKIEKLSNDFYDIARTTLEERKQILSDIHSFIYLDENEIEQILNQPNKIRDILYTRLIDKRERIESSFYETKAKELFLNSGFLTKTPIEIKI